MIKIVHIIGYLATGGAEKLLLDLCKKLDKAKFDVSVITLQENNNSLQLQFEEAGIYVKRFFKKGKLDFQIVQDIAKYLKVLKPDIVHTHLFAADFWGAWAAGKAGCKTIISTKHDVIYEGAIKNWLSRRMRKRCKKIIAISEAIRDYLLKKEKLPNEKITVIHNGIDVGKFYNGESRIFENKDKLRIVSVGRLSKEKGHKYLIRACRFIKNIDWDLTIVGDGPMKKELRQTAHFLGLEGRIHFTGFVDDVREHLNKADLFVLPSLTEGLSLAVLEAALSGCFIIASDVGGVPEIVRGKETGLLFKPKNIERLVEHIGWAAGHAEEVRKMAERLQKQVKEKFDIMKIVKEYERLYKDLNGSHL